MSTEVLVFSRDQKTAEVYAEEYLKKFFTQHDNVRFDGRGYIYGSEGIRMEAGWYIAIDMGGPFKTVQDCVDNLRRTSVLYGFVIEVIFMDLYLIVDPVARAKEIQEHRAFVKKQGEVR